MAAVAAMGLRIPLLLRIRRPFAPNDELHASTTLRAVAEQFPLRHATEAERTTILHLASITRIEPALARP
jgi:elongation factor P--beta-lysine ligase